MASEIIMIAAVDKEGGIGFENHLLFSIHHDLSHFRSLTEGHTVLYGRKTLETFPGSKPLPRRRNLILSSSLKSVDGAEVFASLDDALVSEKEEIWCIGGGEVYRQVLPFAGRIELTCVHEKKKADAFFPELKDDWSCVSRSADLTEDGIGFHYETWIRNVSQMPERLQPLR